MADRFDLFTVSVSRIFQSIQKIQRQEMACYGLKGAHVACLLTLHQHPEGITAAKLGKLCEKDKAAISRTLSEMEHAGVVCRKQEAAGSYRALLCLTPAGAEIAEKIRQRTVLAVESAGGGLTEQDRVILYASLARIADNLQQLCRDGLPGNQEDNR